MNKIKILLLIFLLAIAIRVGLNIVKQEFVLHRPFVAKEINTEDERTDSDAVWYIEAAKGFLKGKGVVSMTTDCVHYDNHGDFPINGDKNILDDKYYAHRNIPPLYPLFLAFCFYLGGANMLAYFIPQLVISSLTCLIIYLIAEEIFDRRTALWAGLLMVFYPDLIFWMNFARTETLFIFLLSLGFLLLIKGNSKGNIFLICMSGVVLGLACLTRITLIFFLPVFFIWLAYYFSKDKKESLKVALCMISIAALILLPWALRNYYLFGQFTVFSEEARILTMTIGQQYPYSAINFSYASHKTTFMQTISFIRYNFREYVISCGYRLAILLSPFTAGMKPLAKLYKGLWWLLIFPTAFWGMFISRKEWGSGTKLILIFIVYHVLLHTASYMDLGLIYRYPIQPFICIFTAYGVCSFFPSKPNKETAN
ncbi:MAG: glycosyltransferase family 39 protein [Candidatus Margulisiibacteriota bacterium]